MFRTGTEKETAERKRHLCKMLIGRQRVPKTQTLQHAELQVTDPPFWDFPVLLANRPETTVKIYICPLLINDTETIERKRLRCLNATYVN